MLFYLILILVLVPVVELVILLQVHHALASHFSSLVALLVTVGTIVVTGVLGAALARQQGTGVFRDLQEQLGEGKPPGRPLVDGVLILIGGALLLTPGFLTDLLGFSLLIPLSRAGYRKLLLRWYERKIQAGEIHVTTTSQRPEFDRDDQVIDATASPAEDSEAGRNGVE